MCQFTMVIMENLLVVLMVKFPASFKNSSFTYPRFMAAAPPDHRSVQSSNGPPLQVRYDLPILIRQLRD
jgi:hypothetical protein